MSRLDAHPFPLVVDRPPFDWQWDRLQGVPRGGLRGLGALGAAKVKFASLPQETRQLINRARALEKLPPARIVAELRKLTPAHRAKLRAVVARYNDTQFAGGLSGSFFKKLGAAFATIGPIVGGIITPFAPVVGAAISAGATAAAPTPSQITAPLVSAPVFGPTAPPPGATTGTSQSTLPPGATEPPAMGGALPLLAVAALFLLRR